MIEVGLIEQAAQVNIQDPLFPTERVQVESHLFDDGPGGQDHATYTILTA